MLVLVVHNEVLRALALNAATLLTQPPLVLDASPAARPATARAVAAALGAARAPTAPAPLLVHDFAPDPAGSVAWLDALLAARPDLTLVALLGAPADPALHLLVGHPHRFVCADMVLGREVTARTLAQRIAEAQRGAQHAAVTRTLATRWPLDALLVSLARQTLAQVGGHRPGGGDAGWPTLDGLLRSAGVARRTFVRHATRAGFHPPMRFLQVLRVLGVAARVHGGETAAAAAARFGYGSPDTMRRHFATLAGLTPRDARHLDVGDLIDRMRGTPAPAVTADRRVDPAHARRGSHGDS